MGPALEFILKLQDLLTPGMRAAGQVADTVANKIQTSFERVRTSSKTMAASVDELRTRLESVNRVRFSTRIKAEFDDATRSAQQLERQIAKLEGRGSSGSMIRNIATAASAAAMLSFGGSSIRDAMDFNTRGVSFEVLTGSAARGQALAGKLNELKQNTIMGTSVYQNAQTMLGFGVNEKDVIGNLRMIGDIAQGNRDRMGQLTLAFSQTQAAGRLMGQDLLQYINAGFNPLGVMRDRWQEFGFKTKHTIGELKTMMEQGAISSDMVAKAFLFATSEGGRYHNMMQRISETSAGKLLLLEGKFAAFKISLGAALMPLADVLIKMGTHVLDLIHLFQEGEPTIIGITAAVGAFTVAVMWNNIATGSAALATKAWAGAQALLNLIMNMNPLVLLITLIIAVGVWIYALAKRYDGWGKSMLGLWDVIKGFVKLNFIAWKDFGENIWYWIQYAYLKVKGFVEWIGGAMRNVWNAIQLAAEFKFGEARAALTAEIKTEASTQLEALEKQHQAGRLKNAQDAAAAIQQMQDGFNRVGLTRRPEAKAVDPTSPFDGGAANGPGSDGSGGGAGIADLAGTGKSRADGINQGGQRNIVINIGKQIESLEVHVLGNQEAGTEIAAIVREELRRVLYSLNGVAS